MIRSWRASGASRLKCRCDLPGQPPRSGSIKSSGHEGQGQRGYLVGPRFTDYDRWHLASAGRRALMEQFGSLDRSVTEVIRQGRIGTAVSLRLVDHTTADHGRIEPILARAIQAVCTWLRGTPEHVSAAG